TGGWGCTPILLDKQASETHSGRQLRLLLHEGEWRLAWDEAVTENVVTRTAVFTTLADSWAMDLVMRFAFRRSQISQAQIADKRLIWDGANYYHQYPVQQVTLFHSHGHIQLHLNTAECPSNWQQVMYVRCSPQEDAWIVHLRLLPRNWQREILKLRLVGARHVVLPDLWGRLLRRWPRLEAHLRYAGEFNRFNFGRINAIPLNRVPAHMQFTISATVRFLHD
ncbi:MAG: hypothetical protein WAS33_17185, partial [Candidatus Promineifilaceae bacterium]